MFSKSRWHSAQVNVIRKCTAFFEVMIMQFRYAILAIGAVIFAAQATAQMQEPAKTQTQPQVESEAKVQAQANVKAQSVIAQTAHYDQVYAIVTIEDPPRVVLRPAKIILSKIGDTHVTRRSELVKPGKVQISADAADGRYAVPYRAELVLEAKPCVRYFLAGRKKSGLDRQFELYVHKTETIGECEATYLR
jgi:hypothetical protein